MIDNTLALLLLNGETIVGATLLALTLAALMLMDFTLDHRGSAQDPES